MTDKATPPTRWTGMVEAHKYGGFVSIGDYERLRARAEAAEKDAARYRKWRADYTVAAAREDDDYISDMLIALSDAWTPDAVDAAIDAAMQASQDTPSGDAT